MSQSFPSYIISHHIPGVLISPWWSLICVCGMARLCQLHSFTVDFCCWSPGPTKTQPGASVLELAVHHDGISTVRLLSSLGQDLVGLPTSNISKLNRANSCQFPSFLMSDLSKSSCATFLMQIECTSCYAHSTVISIVKPMGTSSAPKRLRAGSVWAGSQPWHRYRPIPYRFVWKSL